MSVKSESAVKIVGAIAAAIFILSMIVLMGMGDYGFFAALFLSLLIALLAAIVIYLAFGGGATATAPVHVAKPAPVAAPNPAPTAPKPAAAPAAAAPKPTPTPQPAASGSGGEALRPAGLSAPRGGKADDLKQIKGVGPKLEKLCNELGFWHFDQVAAWTPDEVAWVDENLKGFKGRVSRDNWVEQARVLGAGGQTEFSKRVKGGDVY